MLPSWHPNLKMWISDEDRISSSLVRSVSALRAIYSPKLLPKYVHISIKIQLRLDELLKDRGVSLQSLLLAFSSSSVISYLSLFEGFSASFPPVYLMKLRNDLVEMVPEILIQDLIIIYQNLSSFSSRYFHCSGSCASRRFRCLLSGRFCAPIARYMPCLQERVGDNDRRISVSQS